MTSHSKRGRDAFEPEHLEQSDRKRVREVAYGVNQYRGDDDKDSDGQSEVDKEARADDSGSGEEDEEENPEDEDEDDDSSRMSSGSDSDAAYNRYLTRKEEREQDRARTQAVEYNKTKETIVRERLASLQETLKNGESIPTGPIDNGSWDLFSEHYYSHYYEGMFEHSKSISFRYWPELEDGFPLDAACRPGELVAEVLIEPVGCLNTWPFTPPENASLEPLVLRCLPDGKEVEVTFFGEGYIRLSVSLDILMGEESNPCGDEEAETIDFYGIYTSKEERRRLREEAWRSYRQSSSPRESMGASLGGY